MPDDLERVLVEPQPAAWAWSIAAVAALSPASSRCGAIMSRPPWRSTRGAAYLVIMGRSDALRAPRTHAVGHASFAVIAAKKPSASTTSRPARSRPAH